MRPPKGFEVDHINRIKLDYRRANLRLATVTENIRNKGLTIRSTSGYIGVTWYKMLKKWTAHAGIGKQKLNLGYYTSKEEAARVRDVWVRANHGKFGVLNFPLDQAVAGDIDKEASEGRVARHVGDAERRIVSGKKNSRVVASTSCSGSVLDAVDRE